MDPYARAMNLSTVVRGAAVITLMTSVCVVGIGVTAELTDPHQCANGAPIL